MVKVRRPKGSMLYGRLGVDFFSNLDLLYANMKAGLRLKGTRHIFYIISNNPKVRLGTVDCSLCTNCNALKDGYYNKRMVERVEKTNAKENYSGVQVLGVFGKDVYHPFQTKPVYSGERFKQCSRVSNCH